MPYDVRMCSIGLATDWPAWINAVTVVLLASITAWYAFTTQKMLHELQAERADRLAAVRAPFQNIVEFTKGLLAQTRSRTTEPTTAQNERAAVGSWDDLRERILDRFEEAKARSEHLHRALIDLHTATQHVDRTIQAVSGAKTAGRDPAPEQRLLEEHLLKISAALDVVRREVGRFV